MKNLHANNMDDDLLIKYFTGDLSGEDAEAIRLAIEADPVKKEYLEQMEKIWKLSGGIKDFQRIDTARDWDSLRGRFGFSQQTAAPSPINKTRSLAFRIILVAAMILLVFAAGFMIYYYTGSGALSRMDWTTLALTGTYQNQEIAEVLEEMALVLGIAFKETDGMILVATLEQALKVISREGEFTFTYGSSIPVQKQVVIKAGEYTVKEALDHLLHEVPVDYIEKKGKILLIPRKENIGLTQTVRGRIVDKDSGLPIPGVNVYIASPLKGSVTDLDGNFRLKEIPVGRHQLEVSCMGYEGKSLPGLLVHSGKETILAFELEESILDIGEVTIRHKIDKLKPVNDLSVISTIPLSAEDLTYCPGTMNDISRAAVSLAGVASPNDGQNQIVIRGNSPKGLHWRLEGIEVPNMNHFGEIGYSGGGINMLTNNMLGRSDFFTGAFPAEYGNALSGVFDLNLRTGNNEKHEQTFQIGVIGTEFMAEGPLNRQTGATYIAQFRFYTLALVHMAGLMEHTPDFTDLSFKFHLPTRRLGTFSIFGIGGKSHEKGDSGYDWYNDVATLGVSNELGLNERTRIRTIAAFSFWKYRWDTQRNMGTRADPIDYNAHNDVRDITPRLSVTLNKKLNARHRVRTGVIYTHALYNSFMGWYSDTLSDRALDPNRPLYSNDLDYEHIWVDSKITWVSSTPPNMMDLLPVPAYFQKNFRWDRQEGM